MPWAVAAAVIGAGASIYASSEASGSQEDAGAKAAALERESNAQIRGDLAPYRDVGAKGTAEYAALMGLEGPEAQAAARGRFTTSPGYEFAFDEGTRAVEGGAAARGGLLSGGTLKDLTRFGQGQANKEYTSYLDRFLGLSSLGENAAAQTGNFASTSAGRQGAYALDAGAARAGGYLSAAEGVNGAISNGLNFYGYGKGREWMNGNRTSGPDPYGWSDSGWGY